MKGIQEMITMKELAGKFDEIKENLSFRDSTIYLANLHTLCTRLNRVRESFGQPMVITSGFRSKQDHIRIYNQKGITDWTKIPWHSQHLQGAAADIYDSNLKLKNWVLSNQDLMKEIGLWCEDFNYCSTWVHFQIYKYQSYKEGDSIFFKP